MTSTLKLVAVTVLATAVGLGAFSLLATTPPTTPASSPSPRPSPTAESGAPAPVLRGARGRAPTRSANPLIGPRQPHRADDRDRARGLGRHPGPHLRQPVPGDRRAHGGQHRHRDPEQLLRGPLRHRPRVAGTHRSARPSMTSSRPWPTCPATGSSSRPISSGWDTRARVSSETGPASVAECTDGFAHAWETQYNETAEYLVDGQHNRLWVVDIDGTRVVVTLPQSVTAPYTPGPTPRAWPSSSRCSTPSASHRCPPRAGRRRRQRGHEPRTPRFVSIRRRPLPKPEACEGVSGGPPLRRGLCPRCSSRG